MAIRTFISFVSNVENESARFVAYFDAEKPIVEHELDDLGYRVWRHSSATDLPFQFARLEIAAFTNKMVE